MLTDEERKEATKLRVEKRENTKMGGLCFFGSNIPVLPMLYVVISNNLLVFCPFAS